MNETLRERGRGLFITGTDTGVGKTVVTAGLLRYLRRSGVDAVSMKPVQTGADRAGDFLRAPDFEFHCAVAEFEPPSTERPLMTPYVYSPACSPHLAARLAGFAPEISHIVDCAHKLLDLHQFVLVEGAGGVMVPLNEHDLMIDLIAAMGFPVLVVARAGLGTINHTLLTVEALRSAGATLAGIVLNESTPGIESWIRDDNLATINFRTGVPIWGCLAYTKSLIGVSSPEWDLAANRHLTIPDWMVFRRHGVI